MKTLRRVIDAWVDRPLLDYPVTLLLASILAVWAPRTTLRPGDHAVWYQTLSAVSLGLLMLGTIVVTLVFTVTPTDRLESVFDQFGQGLRRLVVRCLGALVMTTAGFAGLFLLELHVPRWIRIASVVGLVVFTALRFGRLWWLLRMILTALMKRPVQRQVQEPPTSWTRPEFQESDYQVPLHRDQGRR